MIPARRPAPEPLTNAPSDAANARASADVPLDAGAGPADAADAHGADAPPPHARLSNREHQVLCMIGRGLRVRDIADELHLSEKTISTYRTRLLEKLALRTTAQIIRYAIQHDLSD